MRKEIDLRQAINAISDVVQNRPRPVRQFDQIEFHPAWHELMTLAMRDEFLSLCWTKPKPGAQVARAAVSFLDRKSVV